MITQVTDLIGNKLQKGTLLLWKSTGLICKVGSIEQGGIFLEGQDKQRTPGRLMLEIELPFDPNKPLACFQDFVAVVDPSQQQVVEAIAQGMKVVKMKEGKPDGEPIQG